jgi:hypothetical protein
MAEERVSAMPWGFTVAFAVLGVWMVVWTVILVKQVVWAWRNADNDRP